MKRNNVPAITIEEAVQATESRKVWVLAVMGVVLSLVLMLVNQTCIRWSALFGSVGVIVLLIKWRGNFLENFSWLTAAAAAVVLMNGISTLYAVSGKFALKEFLKMLCGFCLFLAVLTVPRKKTIPAGRTVATALSGVCAVWSLVSIDLLSTRLLATAYMSIFGYNMSDLNGVEAGVRMIGMFGNANSFAGTIGIGVLLALGLASTEKEKKLRRLHLSLLAINSLAFVLAFSMGASFMICLGFGAFLAFEKKERRISDLILMGETLVLTLINVFPIYLTAFDIWDGIQPVPLLVLAADAVLLILTEEKLGDRLRQMESGKKAWKPLCVFLGATALYLVLALTVTSGITVSPGETLSRAAYPEPGDYTLSLTETDRVNVVIESQNKEDTMMHTDTVLYSGPADGAAFTVPEDSLVVYFRFTTETEAVIEKAEYSGTEDGALKLGYVLLPGFIANRLQGILANENAIQRVVFFQDGLKLFAQRPLFGRGIGGFESGYFSVQEFYYTSRYTHNHYIQTMTETGIVGLILFLAEFALAFWAIIRDRKRTESSTLNAALFAALIFVTGHIMVEVDMSAFFFVPVFYGLLALIQCCCGDCLPPIALKKTAKTITAVTVPLGLAVFCVLLCGNLRGIALAKQGTLAAFEKAVKLDSFEKTDYELSYAYGVAQMENPSDYLLENAGAYIADLEKRDSNTVFIYLSECYFSFGNVEKAFEMLEKHITYQLAKSEAWEDVYQTALIYDDGSEAFRDGMQMLYDKMNQWNEENMGTIAIDSELLTYVEAVLAG